MNKKFNFIFYRYNFNTHVKSFLKNNKIYPYHKECFNIIAILFISITNIYSQNQNKYPFNQLDVLEYRIFIDLTESFELKNNSLKGNVIIGCIVDTLSLEEIYFDAVSLVIDSIFVNKSKTNFTLAEKYLKILLKEKYFYGDALVIDIFYNRLAGNKPGYYFHQKSSTNAEDLAYSASWPANTRFWLPCKDWPHDKAFVEMRIKVPQNITAVSNGKLIDKTQNSDHSIFTWRDPFPMATYVISISASKYSLYQEKIPKFSDSADSILTSYFFISSDSLKFLQGFLNLPQIINFYSTKFIPYPFDNLNLVQLPKFVFTAMSNQTTIQFYSILNQDDIFVLPHEIAHQWFGCFINSEDWKYWMTEGLAEYARVLYVDFIQGNNFYKSYVKKSAIWSLTNTVSILDGNDSKLAAVLEMLKTTLGDSLYWQCFNGFLKSYAYHSASVDDFNKIINGITGNNYNWFFKEWFYNGGYPVYNFNWNTIETDGKYYITISIKQEQTDQEVFIMPINLTFLTEEKDTTIKVINDQREQDFHYVLDSQPLDIIFDKDSLILIKKVEYQVTGIKEEYLRNFQLSQNYPNPFNPSTVISYQLAVVSQVTLMVYDILGNEIITLVNKEQSPGEYEVEFDGTKLASGVYFYRLKNDNYSEVKKMVLLR